MIKNVLTIGQESSVSYQIADLCRKNGADVVAFASEKLKNTNTINWGKSSYLSSKTAFRELTRQEIFPSDVLIFFGKHLEEKFLEHSNIVVDDIVDREFKSYIYVFQEIYKYVSNHNLNTAIYLIYEKTFDANKPLSSSIAVAFKAYIQAIMDQGSSSKIYMSGYEFTNEDEQGFAEFIFKSVSERSPRRQNSWVSYPKGMKLFGIR